MVAVIKSSWDPNSGLGLYGSGAAVDHYCAVTLP
jgi:hypothetical protein